jgi:hypothetical protein
LNAIWTLGLKLVDTSPEEQLEGYLDNPSTPQRHKSTLSAENNNGNGTVPLRDWLLEAHRIALSLQCAPPKDQSFAQIDHGRSL